MRKKKGPKALFSVWEAFPPLRSLLPDGDSEVLAERKVGVADREDDEFLELLRRREVAGELGLGGNDLLRDVEVAAEDKTGARRGDFDRLDPALEVGLGAVLDELLNDDLTACAMSGGTAKSGRITLIAEKSINFSSASVGKRFFM